MEILVFPKHNTGILSPKLTLSEFDCKCSNLTCTRTLVLSRTVRSFNLTRSAYKAPIRVNSAFRCQVHNEAVGGLENSYHRVGAAMDIAPVGDFTVDEFNRLEELARLYFDVVLRYEGFLHCHNISDDGIKLQEH